MFRENEIIILIGAGCSVDAGIPASGQMIKELENLLKDGSWKEHSDLYHLFKSAILYSDGIKGKHNNGNSFDIERLVNVLQELQKRDDSPLYPFIGSWSPRLLEVGGYRFEEIINKFKKQIIQELNKWVSLSDYRKADYYKKLFDFQKELNFSLRVFSLNYDLCIEKNKSFDMELERGFDSDTKIWNWGRFEPIEEYTPNIYLYKLHGSIDWERDHSSGILREVDSVPSSPDLIFGTNYKMQYIDPYLFYAYEFRKYSLQSKVVLAIGYSFRDEHINGMLIQALKNDTSRKIIIISPDADAILNQFVSNKPELKNQIIPYKSTAKNFLNNEISIQKISELL